MAVASAHLARHGVEEFTLAEHVYVGGRRRKSQVLEWSPGMATFACSLCESIIATGLVTPERVMLAQLHDPGLKPFLAGPHTPEERDQITRTYLAQELTEPLVRRALRPRARQPRPAVTHRKERVQKWLLDRYAARGVVERVLEDALALHRDDPDAWARLSDLAPIRSTLRKYWYEIPAPTREAALRRYHQGQEVRRTK